MLKAGALPYSILISLLLIAICTMLIEGQFLNAKLLDREELTVRLNDNIESGINVLLCKPDLLEYKKSLTISLFDDTLDKVLIEKKIWGAFELVKIKSEIGLLKVEKNILLGSARGADSLTALFMSRQNNYLFVIGKTLIKGNCFVPGGIIKTGQFDGRKFEGTNAAEGILHESISDLPEINKDIINQFGNYMDHNEKTDSVISFEKAVKNQIDINNSFENKTLLFNSDGPILLSHIKLVGNIIIQSSKMVEVDSSAKLQGIIIYAPKIFIKDYFKGIIQVFGSDTIGIGKNCKLKYPSFVGVISKASALIEVNEGSKIQGAVFLYQKENTSSQKSLLTLYKGSEITGSVFCNANIDHRGKVSGIMYCNSFVLKLKASIYENYLMDAGINAENLPKFYVGPMIMNNSKRELVEWLN